MTNFLITDEQKFKKELTDIDASNLHPISSDLFVGELLLANKKGKCRLEGSFNSDQFERIYGFRLEYPPTKETVDVIERLENALHKEDVSEMRKAISRQRKISYFGFEPKSAVDKWTVLEEQARNLL